MNMKKIIASGGLSLFALSSILTPVALANYDGNHHNNNDNNNNRYNQQLRACVRILNEHSDRWNDMNNNWNNNNYWNNTSNRFDKNTKQNLRLCIQILNARHNWNDHNYWNNSSNWDNHNWDNHSNQHNWNDRRNW